MGGGLWLKNYDLFVVMNYELLSVILEFFLWYFQY